MGFQIKAEKKMLKTRFIKRKIYKIYKQTYLTISELKLIMVKIFIPAFWRQDKTKTLKAPAKG